MHQTHFLASLLVLSATTLLAPGCNSPVGSGSGGDAGSGGAGGEPTTNGVTTSIQAGGNQNVSSGPSTYGDNCTKPTGFLLSVTLNDGTSLPSNSTAPSSTTTIEGTVHLLAQGGYTVTAANDDVVTVGEDASTTTFAGITEGMSATLYVGYQAPPPNEQFTLQVELTNAQGDLVYFAIVGQGDPLPDARVGVEFGDESCAKGVSSGTGSINQISYKLNVSIDSAPLGSFLMGMPDTQTIGTKSYEVDDHASLRDFFSITQPVISVLGRQSP